MVYPSGPITGVRPVSKSPALMRIFSADRTCFEASFLREYFESFSMALRMVMNWGSVKTPVIVGNPRGKGLAPGFVEDWARSQLQALFFSAASLRAGGTTGSTGAGARTGRNSSGMPVKVYATTLRGVEISRGPLVWAVPVDPFEAGKPAGSTSLTVIAMRRRPICLSLRRQTRKIVSPSLTLEEKTVSVVLKDSALRLRCLPRRFDFAAGSGASGSRMVAFP